MRRNTMFICSISVVLLIGLIINFSADGFGVNLGATCSFKATEARAKVTWIHSTYLWDLIVPHPHRVDYSVSARVGNQKADSKADSSFFMSNNRFLSPASVIAFQKGNQRWNGDGYASGSISEADSQDNWRFCSKPQQ